MRMLVYKWSCTKWKMEKASLGFCIHKIWQILKHFAGGIKLRINLLFLKSVYYICWWIPVCISILNAYTNMYNVFVHVYCLKRCSPKMEWRITKCLNIVSFSLNNVHITKISFKEKNTSLKIHREQELHFHSIYI